MLRNGMTRTQHQRWPGGDGSLSRRPTSPQLSADRVPTVPGDDTPHDPELDQTDFDESMMEEAEAAMRDARDRLAGIPAEVVVSNHVMGLYELAAIHLSAQPPSLVEAALAIDAVGCLVEGLGSRLGPDSETLQQALSNIRLAFVQIKGASGA